MMPAMRAAPSTSPFTALPLSTTSSVSVRMMTWPSATATRSVSGFPVTSTMRASPPAPRCESLAAGGLAGGFLAMAYLADLSRSLRGNAFAGEQRAGGRGNVLLPHQAFADEEGANADGGKPCKVGRRVDAAFADDQLVLRHARREPLAHGERGL